MKRFLLFFVLILGFVSATFAQTGTVPEVDYSAMITTFAGFVGEAHYRAVFVYRGS